MKQSGRIVERIAGQMDLQGEAIPGLPLVELYGDRRVLIENHMGVTEYGTEAIRVKVKFGQVAVCGSKLELALMTGDQLIITGLISGIMVERGQGR